MPCPCGEEPCPDSLRRTVFPSSIQTERTCHETSPSEQIRCSERNSRLSTHPATLACRPRIELLVETPGAWYPWRRIIYPAIEPNQVFPMLLVEAWRMLRRKMPHISIKSGPRTHHACRWAYPSTRLSSFKRTGEIVKKQVIRRPWPAFHTREGNLAVPSTGL